MAQRTVSLTLTGKTWVEFLGSLTILAAAGIWEINPQMGALLCWGRIKLKEKNGKPHSSAKCLSASPVLGC